MKRITELVKDGSILISDGAWGTFLQQKGLEPGKCPEEWNVLRKNDVLEIAQSYIDAGSDMILTNSFGANRFKLKNYGLQDKEYIFCKAAAQISREAAGSKIVFGSIGPTGKFLLMGEVTEEDLYEAFSQMAKGFEDGGADGCVIETFYDLQEAEIALKAVKENTSLEVACTFTFEKNPIGEFKTMMGISPEDYVNAINSYGADIIGSNCGNGFAAMVELTRLLRKAEPEKPVLIHANAGLPQINNGEVIYPETPEYVKNIISELLNAGANIIGGCCGTTPEHIKAMKSAVLKTS